MYEMEAIMNRIAVSEFFAASCTPEGGAYRYRLYADGQTELLQKIPITTLIAVSIAASVSFIILFFIN